MDDKYRKASDIINGNVTIWGFYADRLDQLARTASGADYEEEPKKGVNEKRQPHGSNYATYLAHFRAGRKQTVDRERERMERIIQLCEQAEGNNRRDAYVRYARARGLSEQHIEAVLNAG
jgi:pyrroloquinoline quinone (PQQ) biosynthesis protein C